MKTNLSKKLFSSKGFTLIELLVVIAILGVLAAALLIILNPGQRVASARNARVKADIANVGTAAGIFYTDSGTRAGCTVTYPGSFGFVAPGCTVALTFMASALDPVGVPYDVEANAACTAAAPCSAVAIAGPAFADGATAAGVWCWRSATGVSIYEANDAACFP